MICFENNHEYNLKPAEYSRFESYVSPLLGEDEQVLLSSQCARDGMIFTTQRIFAVDIQNMLGTKADVSMLPYKSVQSFAADKSDDGGALELFLSGKKSLRFVFTGGCELTPLTTTLVNFTL